MIAFLVGSLVIIPSSNASSIELLIFDDENPLPFDVRVFQHIYSKFVDKIFYLTELTLNLGQSLLVFSFFCCSYTCFNVTFATATFIYLNPIQRNIDVTQFLQEYLISK